MTTPDVTAPRLPWDAADPYPFYDTRRREDDVVWDDTAQSWLVLGYHAAREVLAGTDWISDPRANRANAEALKFLNPQFVDASMLFTDGLPHIRLRGAVRDVFTRSFIAGLTEGVESICADAVAAIATGDDFDVMSQIALPLPIAVIGAWLGLDTDQCAALREHSPPPSSESWAASPTTTNWKSAWPRRPR
jgi:cytochrome P450